MHSWNNEVITDFQSHITTREVQFWFSSVYLKDVGISGTQIFKAITTWWYVITFSYTAKTNQFAFWKKWTKQKCMIQYSLLLTADIWTHFLCEAQIFLLTDGFRHTFSNQSLDDCSTHYSPNCDFTAALYCHALFSPCNQQTKRITKITEFNLANENNKEKEGYTRHKTNLLVTTIEFLSPTCRRWENCLLIHSSTVKYIKFNSWLYSTLVLFCWLTPSICQLIIRGMVYVS